MLARPVRGSASSTRIAKWTVAKGNPEASATNGRFWSKQSSPKGADYTRIASMTARKLADMFRRLG